MTHILKVVRKLGWAQPLPLLFVPWLAGFDWSLMDYLVMGLLLALAGLLITAGLRVGRNSAYRLGVVIAVLAGLLLLWANGAVGLLGEEDNPANLMFFGVIAVAVIGAMRARLRPAGMARAMLATLTAQALAEITGLAAGWSAPGAAGTYEVVMGIGLFGGLWLLAAALFRKAAAQMGG